MKTSKHRVKSVQPFSKILRALLKEKKITIAQAAKASGVSPSTISDWKEGASPENYLAVQKLAEFLDVSFSFLLTGRNEERESVPSIAEVFEEGEFLFDGVAQITIKRLIPKTNKKLKHEDESS